MAMRANAKGEGFRKSPRTHAEKFELVDRRGKIADLSDFEKMFGVVEIQAGKFMEEYILLKLRIWGTGQHVDLMSELFERAAQILDVYPLPAAGGIAPIGQKTYPQEGSFPIPMIAVEVRLVQYDSPFVKLKRSILR
jgi:hypothetical protein